MLPQFSSVLIVGGGPCGLMLANELGRRGIDAVLINDKDSTAFNPQANATQARTMEHFRRLGFADEVRELGLPPDFPTDIAYFTRYGGYEIGRFRLPTAREARSASAHAAQWSSSELPHRVSQKFVERVLRKHAEILPEYPSIMVSVSWSLPIVGTAWTRSLNGRAMAQGRHCDAATFSGQTVHAVPSGSNSEYAIRAKPDSCGISWAGGCMRSIFGRPISTARCPTRRPG